MNVYSLYIYIYMTPEQGPGITFGVSTVLSLVLLLPLHICLVVVEKCMIIATGLGWAGLVQ